MATTYNLDDARREARRRADVYQSAQNIYRNRTHTEDCIVRAAELLPPNPWDWELVQVEHAA